MNKIIKTSWLVWKIVIYAILKPTDYTKKKCTKNLSSLATSTVAQIFDILQNNFFCVFKFFLKSLFYYVPKLRLSLLCIFIRRYFYISCFSSFLNIFIVSQNYVFKLLWFKTKVNNAYKSKSNPVIRTNESEAVRRVRKKPTDWAKYHFIATVQGMWNFRSVCMCVSFPFATISFFFWEIKCHSYSLAEKRWRHCHTI